MMQFPKTRVMDFRHTNKAQRWGQAFYDYMELHKVTDPDEKVFCDKLYNADNDTAKMMVASRTDPMN